VTNENEPEVRAGMAEPEMRANLIRLVFGGDEQRYRAFCREVASILPSDAAAVVRGSSVTGERAEDGAPFDADGPGTSDVDLTLVGATVLDWFEEGGFYVPGSHSKPLSDDHPGIAPTLVPLREKLSAMAGRPVNIQCTRDWVMFIKEVILGQPYLTIVGKLESS
jgi:hypothetical protein